MAQNETYPLALPQGTVLAGQYVIGQALGQGGFGITYKATDHKTGASVAVKEFFPDSLASRTTQTTVTAFPGERGESFVYGKECFLQEAETLAKFIGNENIVRVYSYFEENGTAYFVMEYIEGTSFDRYIKEQGGKVSYEEAEKILLPIIDALAAVHAKGIVHRDVTPDNIYITKDGKVKLLDFGAARYSLGDKSRSLDVVLKHGFAPKEQYTRHGRQGAFTDVYTVGASFYFAITGRRPPDSIDRMDEDELIPPSSLVRIPPEKEDAILKAMSVQPANRYQTMVDFRQALMRAPEAGAQNIGIQAGGIQNTGMQPTAMPQGIQLQSVQQRVFTIPQPIPVQEAQNVEPQPQKKEREKKKWIIPVGIGAGIIAAAAIMIMVASSGGNAKEDPSDRAAMRTEETTPTETKPETIEMEPENEISLLRTISYENCDYECYSDGTAVLKKANNAAGAVNIPATVEYQSQTFRVTKIEDWAFESCSSLTGITLPNSVTEIGYAAFKDCSSLAGIELPDGVTSIGESAFESCSSLKSITIPDSVTEIGYAAFYDCSSLTSIELPNGVTSIGESAFYGCSSLTGIELPDSVTFIGSYAFYDCSSLAGIEIPDSVTSIGSYAFYGCSSLTGIEKVTYKNWDYECYSNGTAVLTKANNATGAVSIPVTVEYQSQTFRVTNIGGFAFSDCSSLTSIEIPDSITALWEFAFNGCSSLTSIEIPDSVIWIGNAAFSGCSSLTSIEIPDSVTEIGSYTFEDCSSLTSIELPNGVTEIWYFAFSGCSSLTSIEIPDSVTNIWSSAFEGCSSLTSIELPASVTSIWGFTFNGCSSLANIKIPDSVIMIGDSAFNGCSSLTSIEIPDSVFWIGDSVFEDCSSLTNVIYGGRQMSLDEFLRLF